MIATLSGVLTEIWPNSILVEVGGVGYQVFIAQPDFAKLTVGQKIRLYTHDHLREGAHDLYGFIDATSKELFEQLISISGVGPKMAIAILSSAKANQLKDAIASGQSEVLQTVSGVGKRTAERIVVELKNKVVGSGASAVQITSEDPAYEALRQLGYNHAQARQAVESIPADVSKDSDRIKQALRAAGR